MVDWYVILAPVLLLAVVALLRFIGCDVVFGLEEVDRPPTVTVIPNAVTLGPLQTQQFAVEVNGQPVPGPDAAWSAEPAGVGILETTGLYRAPASIPAAQEVTIRATKDSGSGIATVTLMPPIFVIRVNCGAAADTVVASQVWSADVPNPNFVISGGTPSSGSCTVTNRTSEEAALYLTLRLGDFSYQFLNLPIGQYTVNLKFAELFLMPPAERRFNVAINGMAVLTDFNIAAEGGYCTAVDKLFAMINVTGGQITIQLSTGTANVPVINAIEITKVGEL